MARIFISHSSKDNAAAVALHDWLVAEGWDDLFLDLDPERGIAAGERWERRLHEAANRCEAVLFLVSRAWLASPWCLKELHLARKLNKQIFGILIEDLPMAELPVEMTGTWQVVNLAAGSDHLVFHPVVPAIGDEMHATFSASGLRRLRGGLTKAGLDARFFAWPPANDPERPPYRGLRPLEAEDAGIFFGREAPMIEALDRLRGLREAAAPRLFVILGASGAGKSSFLRAGLLPRLGRDDRHFLTLPVVRPERAALSGETGLLRSLEQALKARGLSHTRARLREGVADGAAALCEILKELAERARVPLLEDQVPSPAPTLVLPLDQGEELFLAEGAEEAKAFLALLRGLALTSAPAVIVLMTIRSDAFERLQREEALEALPLQTQSLPPLPRGAYQTVIEGPAERLAQSRRPLKIEPKLTAALLADLEAGGGKDALPLLAFTLERLFSDYGGDGDLKLSEYEAIDRIEGSIAAAVERAFAEADRDPAVPKDRATREALLRRAFIPWLAGIDPETDAPRRRVARLSEIPEEARPLVRHLIEQRLLATDVSKDGGTTIEPAHEALLRQWGLLKGWLKDDIAALTTLEGVKRAARDWAANEEDTAWLSHTAGRLEDAERYAQREDLGRFLTEADRTYLRLCRQQETERRDRELEDARRLAEANAKAAEAARAAAEASRKTARRTLLAAVVAALFTIVAVGFGWYGLDRQEEANRQRTVAEANASEAETQALLAGQRLSAALINESQYLAAEARKAIEAGEYERAIGLALAALPVDHRDLSERPVVLEAQAALAQATIGDRTLRLLWGGDDALLSADFSPDGTLVVTESSVGRLRLWDPTTGAEVPVLHRLQDWVLAFSPDGKRAVTPLSDWTARVWDVASGAELAVLRGHGNTLASAAFSPDGGRVVTASYDGTARVWDAASGAELAVLHGHEDGVTSAIFSPNGMLVLTESWDGTAQVWDAASGAELAVLHRDEVGVKSATFSSDSTRVVAASNDGTVRLWEAASGVELAVLRGHEGEVWSAAFSADGTRVVTASSDGTARVWDAVSGVELAVLRGHERGVVSATFSADGTRVVTAAADNTARLWDVARGATLALLHGHDDAVVSAAFSPDGTRVVTASSDGTARLWDAAGVEPLVLRGHQDKIRSATFSPDGTRVVTASQDGTAQLWDAASGAMLAVLRGHENWVLLGTFSPDGTRVVTASSDGTARLWYAASGAVLAALRGHEGAVAFATFHPDGTRVATASIDGTARLWDATSGEPLAVLRGHKDGVLSVAFSPDGRRVVTASQDSTARLWDAATGAELVVLRGHRRWVLSAVFSPDGTRVVTASSDDTARLWDAASGVELAVLRGHDDSVPFATFSPDGSRVVTASYDLTARIWDAASGALLAVLRGHEELVQTADFSPDGERVVTASEDGTVRVWDVASGAELAVLRGHEDTVVSAAFSPDGSRVVTASADDTARIWKVREVYDSGAAHLRLLRPTTSVQSQSAGASDGGATSPLAESASARCDRLASDPFDIEIAGEGVIWPRLVAQASEASEACQAALELDASEPRLRYQFGRAVEALGDTATAFDAYQAAAQVSYPRAIARMGQALVEGDLGHSVDVAKGVELLSRAEEAGDYVAAYGLHELLWSGTEGLDADRTRAMDLLIEAASRGLPEAHVRLGWIYEIERDPVYPLDLTRALLAYAIAARLYEKLGYREEPEYLMAVARRGSIAHALPSEVLPPIWEQTLDWRLIGGAEQ